MRHRTRKLVGTVVLLTWIAFYTAAAAFVATLVLPGASGLAQLLFYVVAGTVWLAPAGFLLSWMLRPAPLPLVR